MKKYLRIIIYLFIIMFVVMELVFFVRDLLSTNGQKNMADWFSAIGTVAAVIVALFQMLQSKKDRKPIILFTMKHHGCMTSKIIIFIVIDWLLRIMVKVRQLN